MQSTFVRRRSIQENLEPCLDSIIGMNLHDAAAVISNGDNARSFRVVSRDGELNPVSPMGKSDYRVNLVMENGLVVSYTIG